MEKKQIESKKLKNIKNEDKRREVGNIEDIKQLFKLRKNFEIRSRIEKEKEIKKQKKNKQQIILVKRSSMVD